MKYLFLCLLTLHSYAASSQKQVEINLMEVSNHVGDSVKVCGVVASARHVTTVDNTPTFLNLGNAYPNQLLTVVIWDDVRKQFTYKPEEYLLNKQVCVLGRVELYKGKAQIVIHSDKDFYLKQ